MTLRLVGEEGADPAMMEARAAEANGLLYRPTGSLIVEPDDSPPVPFGLEEIDTALGGGVRIGVHVIAGFAHHGKTQLLLKMFHQNRDKLTVLFTPDEDSNQVINKALKLATGIDIVELMNMPAGQKRELFAEHFPNLEICDAFLNKYDLLTYLAEAEQWRQQQVQLVAFDYLGYLSTARGDDMGASIVKAANNAKELVKATNIPWVFIHQANRSAADGSKSLGPRQMAYGGEQQATTIFGVRRIAFSEKATAAERQQEMVVPTVHVGMFKNKQTYQYLDDTNNPGAEIQYAIDRQTGLIRKFKESERLASRAAVMRGATNHGGWQRDD